MNVQAVVSLLVKLALAEVAIGERTEPTQNEHQNAGADRNLRQVQLRQAERNVD